MGIRIGLLEDHPMMREVLITEILSSLSHALPDEEVFVETLTPTELEQEIQFDLAVMDLDLGPSVDTCRVIGRLRDQGIATVLVSAAGTPEDIQRCVHAGALSFVSKQSGLESLAAAILSALKHETYLTPELAGKLVSPVEPRVELSPEQQRALALWSAGMTRHAIAASLGRTTRDVEALLVEAASAYTRK